MKNILLLTQNKDLQNETIDVVKIFKYTLKVIDNIADLLKSLNEDYYFYILDGDLIKEESDFDKILPKNTILLKEKTSKNKLKFLLVDILKKYEIKTNNNISILKIEKILENDNINTKSIGYNYLIDLILLCYQDEKYLKNLNKISYKEIAKKYNTSSITIERDIRTSLGDKEIKATIKNYLTLLK